MADMHIHTLYQNFEDMGVDVFSCPMSNITAIASPDGYVGINPSKIENSAEERVALIHEEAHFATHTFYECDSPYTVRSHQETIASRYGFKKYFPVQDIQDAINTGNTELWQLAEHFEVPCEYMKEVLSYYTDTQGICFFEKEGACREPEETEQPITSETLAALAGIHYSTDVTKLSEQAGQELLQIVQALKAQKRN